MAADLTELRGGLIVSDTALRLALALEDSGHAIAAKDGALHVLNGSTLTAEERAAIKVHKFHLLAIAGYTAPTDDGRLTS